MKSTKSNAFLKTRITTRRINNLVKKALLDCPKHKPAKGMIFLEDKKLGSMFDNGDIQGVLLDSNDSAAQVVIISSLYADDGYYLGKQRISARTEVFK